MTAQQNHEASGHGHDPWDCVYQPVRSVVFAVRADPRSLVCKLLHCVALHQIHHMHTNVNGIDA